MSTAREYIEAAKKSINAARKIVDGINDKDTEALGHLDDADTALDQAKETIEAAECRL